MVIGSYRLKWISHRVEPLYTRTWAPEPVLLFRGLESSYFCPLSSMDFLEVLYIIHGKILWYANLSNSGSRIQTKSVHPAQESSLAFPSVYPSVNSWPISMDIGCKVIFSAGNGMAGYSVQTWGFDRGLPYTHQAKRSIITSCSFFLTPFTTSIPALFRCFSFATWPSQVVVTWSSLSWRVPDINCRTANLEAHRHESYVSK